MIALADRLPERDRIALERMGLIRGGLRLPLTRLAGQYHAAVQAAMQQAGVALGA